MALHMESATMTMVMGVVFTTTTMKRQLLQMLAMTIAAILSALMTTRSLDILKRKRKLKKNQNMTIASAINMVTLTIRILSMKMTSIIATLRAAMTTQNMKKTLTMIINITIVRIAMTCTRLLIPTPRTYLLWAI
jgi:uncharacterized membrane protein